MRAIFITLVVFGLCGCEPPFFDLREPIYLVANPSFWVGCEDDVVGYKACRANRVERVEEGINEWLKHFDEATRPQVVVIY